MVFRRNSAAIQHGTIYCMLVWVWHELSCPITQSTKEHVRQMIDQDFAVKRVYREATTQHI